jgi:hypothetical protein
VELGIELDGIEVDEAVCAGADSGELLDDGLAVDSAIGDVTKRVGVDAEQIQGKRRLWSRDSGSTVYFNNHCAQKRAIKLQFVRENHTSFESASLSTPRPAAGRRSGIAIPTG